VTRPRLRWLLSCLLLLIATTARAQDIPADPSENARFHFGVIRFTPFLALTDIGVDTNVYNEFEDPKQDFTMTMGPGADYWLRLGRARLEAKSDVTYTWFQTYSDQRSLNTDNKAKLSLPLNRLIPFVDGLYNNGRRRVSYEIDSRSYSTDYAVGGGVDIRATAKSTIRVEGHHEGYEFKEDEFFLGTSLRDALNRTADSAGLSLRQALTPLTMFVVGTEYMKERFTYSPIKDADTWRIMPGFEFDPYALIGGRVFVGYKHFQTLSAIVPDYSGVVADVAANYRTHATRLDVTFARDVAYSYQETSPYYILSNLDLKATQKITRQWDVVAHVGRQWLTYREIGIGEVQSAAQADKSWVAGGGMGYQLGEAVRVGIEANYYSRVSNTYDYRGYDGLRVGGSFTYGLSRQ
jgi:hypothetical protein